MVNCFCFNFHDGLTQALLPLPPPLKRIADTQSHQRANTSLPFIHEHHVVNTQLLGDQCVRLLLLVPDSYVPTLGMAALEHDF